MQRNRSLQLGTKGGTISGSVLERRTILEGTTAACCPLIYGQTSRLCKELNCVCSVICFPKLVHGLLFLDRHAEQIAFKESIVESAGTSCIGTIEEVICC